MSQTNIPIKAWWGLFKQVASAWLDDYVPSMGAALAYYTLFSLAPLLLIVVSVAGLVFGEEAARGEIQAQLKDLMGDVGAGAVQGLLTSVREPAEGLTATAVGMVLLFVGATTVFAELQDALDRIWGGWQGVVQAGNAIGGFLLVATMFGLIYKVMPRQRVRLSDVWLGALIAALLFTGGKFLMGAYIGRSGVASGFGAAGSLVVVLLWVYFSAQILLVGAEFSCAYARTFGSHKMPEPLLELDHSTL
jgi:membrane protein